MKIFIILPLLTACFVSSAAHAAYGAYGSRAEASSKYYRGEISAQEYADAQIGPMNVPKSYYGKFEKHPYKAFGEGYRYSDSDGNQMKIEPNRYGGWNVYGN